VSLLEIILLALVLILIAAVVRLALSLRKARELALTAFAERAEGAAVREALEARLELDKQLLDALGESASYALLLLDDNRHVTWGNTAAWELFSGGQPATGKSFIALVRDFELNQALADALANNRSMVRQSAVGERMLRICVTPIERTSGAAVAIEDVSELQRLGRARRDFVANISHELRTPLSTIDLAAQTLVQAGQADPLLTRRMIDQVQAQVQILSQLSQEMMELAQIESGQVLLKLEPRELEPVIQAAVQNLAPQASVKEQRLSVHVPAGLTALIDDAMIGRVVNNLVHNAVKFSPERGTIRVSAEAAGDDVQICVADDGPGIPKDEQRRVFERFYKADRARSRGGTGLGLAIARHIVEGHGGRLSVDSTPGHGAMFCFTVPRA
jgi:two-component system phosphate regulon sensor histidine kinase PhoR